MLQRLLIAVCVLAPAVFPPLHRCCSSVAPKMDGAAVTTTPSFSGSLLRAKLLPCRRIGRRTLIPLAAIRKFARQAHPESPANFSRHSSAQACDQHCSPHNGQRPIPLRPFCQRLTIRLLVSAITFSRRIEVLRIPHHRLSPFPDHVT